MTINMKALRPVIESPVAITLVTAARRRGDEISLLARVLAGVCRRRRRPHTPQRIQVQ